MGSFLKALIIVSVAVSPSCGGDPLRSPLFVLLPATVGSWTSGPQNVRLEAEGLQAAVQPCRHMNRSLYAIVSAALFLRDLAPLVIRSHFHTGDGGGRRGDEETRKQDARLDKEASFP